MVGTNPNSPTTFRRAWLDTRPTLKFAFEWKKRRPHKEKNLVMKRSRRSSIRRTRRAKNRKRLSVCTLCFNHVWMCPDFLRGKDLLIEKILWLFMKFPILSDIVSVMSKCNNSENLKKIYEGINNRFLRERGMVSNPKMEYQVFLCIFQKNSAMATLGLKEMGKFLWEGKEKGLPCWLS